MPDDEPIPALRLRAGAFPAVQVTGFSVAIAAAVYVGGSMVGLLATQWGSTPWLARASGVVLVVGFAALVVLLSRRWVAAANGLRPLVVTPGPDGDLRVPTVSGWRLGRDTVPLVDVRGVSFTLDTTPRAWRWRLVVHADQGTWVSDSVTSMDLRRGGLERSRAQQVRAELMGYAVAARS